MWLHSSVKVCTGVVQLLHLMGISQDCCSRFFSAAPQSSQAQALAVKSLMLLLADRSSVVVQ